MPRNCWWLWARGRLLYARFRDRWQQPLMRHYKIQNSNKAAKAYCVCVDIIPFRFTTCSWKWHQWKEFGICLPLVIKQHPFISELQLDSAWGYNRCILCNWMWWLSCHPWQLTTDNCSPSSSSKRGSSSSPWRSARGTKIFLLCATFPSGNFMNTL